MNRLQARARAQAQRRSQTGARGGARPVATSRIGNHALGLVGAAAVLGVLPVVAVTTGLSFWMVPVLLVAALLIVARRDSQHAMVSLFAVALVWVLAHPSPTSPGNLVVALLMLITHTALAWQATAPPGARLAALSLGHWLPRIGLVALITVLVWAAALAIHHVTIDGTVTVLAAALLLFVALLLLLRDETLAVRRDTNGRGVEGAGTDDPG